MNTNEQLKQRFFDLIVHMSSSNVRTVQRGNFTMVEIEINFTIKANEQVKLYGAGFSKRNPTDTFNPKHGFRVARGRAMKEIFSTAKKIWKEKYE